MELKADLVSDAAAGKEIIPKPISIRGVTESRTHFAPVTILMATLPIKSEMSRLGL